MGQRNSIAEISPPPLEAPSHFGKAAAGYVLAAACLIWVFHDVAFGALFDNVATMNWWWVAIAVAFDILSYVCQGLRWKLLLESTGKASLWQTTGAVYTGLFVNEILPMRAGEIVRIYVMARRLKVNFAAIVPSVLTERLFDAVWLVLAVGVTILFVPLPRYLMNAEEILALIVFGGAAALLYLVVRRKDPSPDEPPLLGAGATPFAKASMLLGRLAAGVGRVGRSRYLYASLGVSCLLLVFQVLAFWLVMWAYGLRVSVWQGAAVLLILHLGTAIPSAPSNIGAYQFFAVVGLTLFGIDKTMATGFSVVVFLILTIPLWVIGLFAFGRAGLHLKTIRTEVAALARN